MVWVAESKMAYKCTTMHSSIIVLAVMHDKFYIKIFKITMGIYYYRQLHYTHLKTTRFEAVYYVVAHNYIKQKFINLIHTQMRGRSEIYRTVSVNLDVLLV